jgi:hypothetical protein
MLAEPGFLCVLPKTVYPLCAKSARKAPTFFFSISICTRMPGFELLIVRRLFPAIKVIVTSGSFCGNEVPSDHDAITGARTSLTERFLAEVEGENAGALCTCRRSSGTCMNDGFRKGRAAAQNDKCSYL